MLNAAWGWAMTKVFDDKARANLLKVYTKPNLTEVKPKQLIVREIDCKTAGGYIAAFHYSKTMPDSTRYVYGLYYGNLLCGVCAFGMGCGKNQYTAINPGAKNGEYIELTRLWLEDSLARNSESYFIAKCLKKLPKEIRFVISFSDEKQGHVGYIYQATNFVYLGQNGGGRMLVTSDGVEKHPRLLGIYRKRHPEYAKLTNSDLMTLLGYKYIDGGRKHRYVYFKDKELQKRLQITPQPYPKKTTLLALHTEYRHYDLLRLNI